MAFDELGEAHELNEAQQRLFDLWRSRREGNQIPRRDAFEAIDFAPWMGDLNMLGVVDAGRDFVYRVFASNVALFLGYDLNGQLMSQHPNHAARAIGFACYREVCRTGLPYLFRRPIVFNIDLDRDKTVVRKHLVLPMAGPTGAVDRILVHHDLESDLPLTREIARSSSVTFIPLAVDAVASDHSIADLTAA